MKAKHTKGEWEFKKGGNFSGTFVNFICTGDIHIAQTRGSTSEMTAEENEANAKLIAAAPDMLEALLEAKGMYEKLEPVGGWQGVYEQIEYAIKKATV